MKTINRCISGSIVVERKDGKIMVNHPVFGLTESFDTEDAALNYIIKCLVSALQESSYNIQDLIKENPDKLDIIFKFFVKSELTSNS